MRLRDELDISLLRASNMRNSIFSQLDASLTVLLYYVTTHVRVTLTTLNYDSIVTTGINSVLPDFGCAHLSPICSSDLNTVLMTALNLVLDQM